MAPDLTTPISPTHPRPETRDGYGTLGFGETSDASDRGMTDQLGMRDLAGDPFGMGIRPIHRWRNHTSA